MSREGFLSRWARLKQESREAEAAPQPALQTAPEAAAEVRVPAAVTAETLPAGEEAPFDPATLPPIESLHKDSDFSPFLQKGVPEVLAKAALRKLWASDPAFNVIDPLDIHNIDYRAEPLVEAVKTVFEVGKGLKENLDKKLAEEAEKLAEGAETAEKASPPGDEVEVSEKSQEKPEE